MSYIHVFKQGQTGRPTFLVLHGTGGDEEDLLPLVNFIDPAASVLSVRGDVNENGMNRFFKRLAMGVFDESDLEMRAHQLNRFVEEAAEKYGFDRENVIALGYSNGANIAASMLYLFANPLRAAILHHPMVPFRERKPQDAKGLEVFIGAGKNDPMCAPEESVELERQLEAAGGSVSLWWGHAGHSLTQEEVAAAKDWYTRHFA